jgi:hypothetical protein
MMHRRLIAGLGLAVAATTLVAAGRHRDTTPANVSVGGPVPEVLGERTAIPGDTGVVDAVFVARDCSACGLLMADLRAIGLTPRAGHRVVFLTDRRWPALDSVAGRRWRVVTGAGSLARSIGLRATPTLIAFAPGGRRVLGVRVGVSTVLAALAAPPDSASVPDTSRRSNLP